MSAALLALAADPAYNIISIHEGGTLIFGDGGDAEALGTAPTIANGVVFDSVATAGGRGGDGLQFNGTNQAATVDIAAIADAVAGQEFTILVAAKWNTPYVVSGAPSQWRQYCGCSSDSSNQNALIIGASVNTSLNPDSNRTSVALGTSASALKTAAYQHAEQGINGQWHLFGMVVSVSATSLWAVYDGTLGTPTTIGAGDLPTSGSMVDFGLGAKNSNWTGSNFCDQTIGLLVVCRAALSQTQIRDIWNAVNGRTGAKIYGSLAESGPTRAARLLAVARSAGVDAFDFGDSNQVGSSTQWANYNTTYNYTNTSANGNIYNRDQGNIAANTVMLAKASGLPIRAMAVGSLVPGGQNSTHYLGIYNAMVASPTAVTGVTHLEAKALDLRNSTDLAGWFFDLGYKASGTQSDSTYSGMNIDPTLAEWPFGPNDELEVVVNYATFASGGGTIRPNVIRVRDSAVVTAATAIACTGSDGWASTTINLGKVTEPLRLRLQDGTAASSKFCIGPCVIRSKSRTNGFSYTCLWAYGGRDVENVCKSLAASAATVERLVAVLTMIRASTGRTTACLIGNWGQNARSTFGSTALDRSYSLDLATQTAYTDCNTLTGHKRNLQAWQYQLKQALIAAGYTSVWFLKSPYHQYVNGGDQLGEVALQRAELEIADEDATNQTIVLDGPETIGDYAKMLANGGYKIGSGSAVDPAHISQRGQLFKGQAAAMVLGQALGQAGSGGTSSGALLGLL